MHQFVVYYFEKKFHAWLLSAVFRSLRSGNFAKFDWLLEMFSRALFECGSKRKTHNFWLQHASEYSYEFRFGLVDYEIVMRFLKQRALEITLLSVIQSQMRTG